MYYIYLYVCVCVRERERERERQRQRDREREIKEAQNNDIELMSLQNTILGQSSQSGFFSLIINEWEYSADNKRDFSGSSFFFALLKKNFKKKSDIIYVITKLCVCVCYQFVFWLDFPT